MKPYVYERQVEQWTNMQLVSKLENLGFQVSWYPISGRLERRLGVDVLFGSGKSDQIKMFGLQYKVLWRGTPDYWPIDEAQHKTLLKTPWASYCLSDMRSMRKASLALDLGRFYTPLAVDRTLAYVGNELQLRESAGGYKRWAKYLEGVEACRAGQRIATKSDFLEAIETTTPEAREILDTILLLSWSTDPDTGELVPLQGVVFDKSLVPSAAEADLDQPHSGDGEDPSDDR